MEADECQPVGEVRVRGKRARTEMMWTRRMVEILRGLESEGGLKE